jgi:hypothetical protein
MKDGGPALGRFLARILLSARDEEVIVGDL